jgi:hypothetical protein
MNCPYFPEGVVSCYVKDKCTEPCDVALGAVKLSKVPLCKELFDLDNQQGVHKGSGKGSGRGKIKTGRPKR